MGFDIGYLWWFYFVRCLVLVAAANWKNPATYTIVEVLDFNFAESTAYDFLSVFK